MNIQEILPVAGFYLFALITVVSACVVAFNGNILRAAFALLFTFFGVAGLYLFLHADFLAATQLLIYVGGVLVLLLFGIMLTQKVVEVDIRTGRIQFIPTLIAMGILFIFLVFAIFETPWFSSAAAKRGRADFGVGTTAEIGTLLMTEWILPFEVASILLLAALVGAVSIARTRRPQP